MSVHFRSHLLSVTVDEDVLPALQGLLGAMGPLMNCSAPLDEVDKITELTLEYMEKMPPASLIHSCNCKTSFSPPVWATAASTPTDYAVLKHFKELRGKSSDAPPASQASNIFDERSIDPVNSKEDADDGNHSVIADSHADTVNQFPQAAVAAGIVPVEHESSDEDSLPTRSWSSTTLIFLALIILSLGVVIAVSSGLIDVSEISQRIWQYPQEIAQNTRNSALDPPKALESATTANLSDKVKAKLDKVEPKLVTASSSRDTKVVTNPNSQKQGTGGRVPMGPEREAELMARSKEIFSRDALLLAQQSLERATKNDKTSEPLEIQTKIADTAEERGAGDEAGGDVEAARETMEDEVASAANAEQQAEVNDQIEAEHKPIEITNDSYGTEQVAEGRQINRDDAMTGYDAEEKEALDQKNQQQDVDDDSAQQDRPPQKAKGEMDAEGFAQAAEGHQISGGDADEKDVPEYNTQQQDTGKDNSQQDRPPQKTQGRMDAERLAETASEQAKQASEQAQRMVAQLKDDNVHDTAAGSTEDNEEGEEPQDTEHPTISSQQRATAEAVLAKNQNILESLSRVWVHPVDEKDSQVNTDSKEARTQSRKKVVKGLAAYWNRIRSKA